MSSLQTLKALSGDELYNKLFFYNLLPLNKSRILRKEERNGCPTKMKRRPQQKGKLQT
jgi:hypothetical protein